MKRKEFPSVDTAEDSAGWQQYFSSLTQHLARSDRDANATIAALIEAVDRSPVDLLAFVNCPPNPLGGFPGVTSNRFYYLSEIVEPNLVDDSAACGAALACFLSQIVAHQVNPENNPPQVHSNATLVVDRVCLLHHPLTLPNRFTLAGVGPDGDGQLVFDLPDNTSAVRFALTNDVAIRMSTIRDIRISGLSCCGQVGINVSNSQFVYIDRIRLSNFALGVFGEAAYSVNISNSSFHHNGFNLIMGEDTTTWRVRDSTINSGLIGVLITNTARGHVISGARIESNIVAGVWVNGSMNVIENSWFEGNGAGPTPTQHGIRITNLAKKTRVLANLFSSQLIQDAGEETSRCFNMSFASQSDDVNQVNC